MESATEHHIYCLLNKQLSENLSIFCVINMLCPGHAGLFGTHQEHENSAL